MTGKENNVHENTAHESDVKFVGKVTDCNSPVTGNDFSDRIGGVDFLKILSCLGVLSYHVLDDFCLLPGHNVAEMAYFAASFCIPMFFAVSGFTFGRRSFSAAYVENKIGGILKKLFGWVIFWCVISVFIYGQKRNPFIDFIDGVFGEGVLPVSWFIFTLCICWLAGYTVFILHQRHRTRFYIFSAALLAVMVLKRSAVVSWNIPFYDSGTQFAWFGLYFTFFVTGMLLRDINSLIVRDNSVFRIAIAVLMVLITYIVSTLWVNEAAPFEVYGNWLYMIWFILIIVCSLNFIKFNKYVHEVSKGTLTVYLWHLPALVYISKFVPVTSGLTGALMIFSLFVIGEILYFMFRNYPLIRKMV